MRFVWAVLAALLLAPLAAAGPIPVFAYLADGEDGALGDGILKLDLPEGNASSRLIISDAAPVVFVGNETIRDGTHLKGALILSLHPSPSAVFDGALQATVKVGDAIEHVASVNVTFEPQAPEQPDPEQTIAEAEATLGLINPEDPEGSGAALYAELAAALPSMDAAPMQIHFGTVDVVVPDDAEVRIELRLVNEDDGGLLPGDVGSGGGILEILYDGEEEAAYLYLPWWTADPDPEPKQRDYGRNYGSSGSGGSGGGGGGSGGSGGGSSGSSTDSAGGDGDVGDGNMTDGDGNETGGKDSPGLPILGAVVVLGAVAWIARRRR